MQAILDKSAIGLSLLCMVHCLVTPLAILLLPGLAVLPLENEAFHFWMVFAVIPTSIFALTMGCKKHKKKPLLIYGVIGLVFLMAAAFLGENVLNEFWEKTLTIVGATIISVAHIRNFRLCSQVECLSCSESAVECES